MFTEIFVQGLFFFNGLLFGDLKSAVDNLHFLKIFSKC